MNLLYMLAFCFPITLCERLRSNLLLSVMVRSTITKNSIKGPAGPGYPLLFSEKENERKWLSHQLKHWELPQIPCIIRAAQQPKIRAVIAAQQL